VIIPELQESKWGTKSIREKNYKIPITERDQENMTKEQKKDAIKNKKIEELRRLFFVACSRAKKELILSYTSLSNATEFLEEIRPTVECISGSNLVEDAVFQDTISRALRIDSVTTDERMYTYIEHFLEHYSLTATHLNIFLESPKKFLEEKIFHYPFEGNIHTVYGTAYHEVMEKLSNARKIGKDIPLSELTNILLSRIKYMHLPYHEKEKLLTQARKALEICYRRQNTAREILYVEYDFRGKKVMFENIPINGKIDKIEKIGPSSTLAISGQLAFAREQIAIVDFKTGKKKYL